MAKKTEKEGNIKDEKSILDDMKRLALDKPKNEVKKTTIPNKEEKKEKQNVKKIEIEEAKQIDTRPVIEKKTKDEEDLAFVEEITTNGIVSEDAKEEKHEKVKEKTVINKNNLNPKPTYEQMFGNRWMGWGFSE